MQQAFICACLTLILSACKREKSQTNSPADCATQQTIRVILNKQATVHLTGGTWYITEQGAIDSKLKPCNLAKEFEVHQLSVVISGEEKATVQYGPGPCCINNFFITKIAR